MISSNFSSPKRNLLNLERKTPAFVLKLRFPNVWIQSWWQECLFWISWGPIAVSWAPERHANRLAGRYSSVGVDFQQLISTIILDATGWIYSSRFGPIAKKNQILQELRYLPARFQGICSIRNTLWEISFWKSWLDCQTLCAPSFESRPDLRIELTF